MFSVVRRKKLWLLGGGACGGTFSRDQSRAESCVRLSLATWNINSVRLRIDLVSRFLPKSCG
jgi:hypothetical protein